MSNLKVRLSQLTTKKVPALALVVVAMLGMVAGVLAANFVVSQTSTTGEIGTYHTSSGTFTVSDTGLFVVANTASTNATTAITIAGTGIALNNALTAGDWMDVVTFVMSTPSATGSPHTATLTFRNGAGPKGTILGSAVTSGAWTTSTSSTGTVTFYVDLGTQSLTSPVTAYISIT
jgi:hypothetical protein